MSIIRKLLEKRINELEVMLTKDLVINKKRMLQNFLEKDREVLYNLYGTNKIS